MSKYKLTGQSISKIFGRRLIFRNINFEYCKPGIYGIAGYNGSGKSTLVKMITGILSPTKGKILHEYDGKKVILEELQDYIGFVAPYLVLYDEFTAEENLKYFAEIRGINYNKEKIDFLLSEFLIYNRKDDYVKGYSSGMKQRLKYIFALMHSPKLVILDEPTSNLDIPGKEVVYKLIEAESASSIILIASNEESDLSLCEGIIHLEEFK